MQFHTFLGAKCCIFKFITSAFAENKLFKSIKLDIDFRELG